MKKRKVRKRIFVTDNDGAYGIFLCAGHGSGTAGV